MIKIKVINPNTTATMTAIIGDSARAIASPKTEIIAVNPPHGPVSIEGHYDEAISVPGVLAEVQAGEAAGVDGYVIACFGDPGLAAARELARGPVLGIAEAAMHAASMIATGFSVVTTLGRTKCIAAHLVEQYGMERFCRGIWATELAVLDLDDPAGEARSQILATCRQALATDECGAIVLGCAGMANLSQSLTAELGIPVIDGVGVAVKFVEALVGVGLGTSKRGDFALPLPKQFL